MQRRTSQWMFAVLLVVPLLLVACGSKVEEAAERPAVVDQVKGTDDQRVTLTAQAAQRLDIQTALVRSGGHGTRGTVIPYGAVLYDANGDTWSFTSPARFVFVRQNITVDRIEGMSAFLTKGPAIGTAVVTVGATELWGVVYGGIKED